MAHDELLPPRFVNLQFGTLCSGIAMALIALFVPFTFLDDFVSAGVLLAFCITNNAVVIFRASSHIRNPSSCDERRLFERELASFNAAAFGGAFFLCYSYFYTSILPIFVVVVLAIRLGKKMTKAQSGDGFEAPTGLPFVAIFINAVLIFQLEPLGLGILFCFVSLCALLYFWSSGSQGADAEVKHRWSEAVRAS
uniref:Cationic amino acid transporter C-terminal domain-containing protein n=1 Tax=Minutocellus polymorphus TaxID=265543 RepID=A0A7S0AHE3_9STRA